jgi:hypothetical protein
MMVQYNDDDDNDGYDSTDNDDMNEINYKSYKLFFCTSDASLWRCPPPEIFYSA